MTDECFKNVSEIKKKKKVKQNKMFFHLIVRKTEFWV